MNIQRHGVCHLYLIARIQSTSSMTELHDYFVTAGNNWLKGLNGLRKRLGP